MASDASDPVISGWSHQLRPQAYPAQLSCLNQALTALGGESVNWAESGEREKCPGTGGACFHLFSLSCLRAQRRLLTLLSDGCWLPGYPQGAGSTAWGVLLSVTFCGLIFQFSEPLTPLLPFLWVFPPSAPYSRRPSRVLQCFPLRCAKPLVTCLDGHALAETPSKREEQQRLFCLFACVVGIFFPQTFSSLLSSSLPTIKLVAMLRRQT